MAEQQVATKQKKVSPAFEAFLAEGDDNAQQEAIVIYRSRERQARTGHRLDATERAGLASSVSAAQRDIEASIFESYHNATKDYLPDGKVLETASIGAATLPVASVQVTKDTLPELAAQDDVVAIMPNQRISLIEPKSVDYTALSNVEASAGMTWGLTELDIPALWNTTTGAGVNVAVLDTGVYAEHPALINRVQSFVMVDPRGVQVQATPMFDGGQHGTHVCGTIAGGQTPGGVAIGVAPEASLFVAAVLVGSATVLTILEGISWATAQGADIISMSLGFSYYEPNFDIVFENLLNTYDILPVAAIGNENHGNSSSPGNAPSAVGVGAIERNQNSVSVASFSSGASLVFPNPSVPLVTKPDVVAPGVQVYSCIPPQSTPNGVLDYTYMDGTSMATPHVAGVAALLMAANPNASADMVMAALKDTATKPPPPGEDNRWGFGLIQPADALSALP